MTPHSRLRRTPRIGIVRTVLVPQAADLFLIMFAEPRVIQAEYAKFFAASLLLLHGPFALRDAELSPYQQERLAQAAALAIHHAADEIERLTPQIVT